LMAAAAKGGDQEPAEDGGIQPALRLDAGGDRDRHRQWQRHDRHGERRQRVGGELRTTIALAQDRYELGREQLAERLAGTRGGGHAPLSATARRTSSRGNDYSIVLQP